VTHFRFVEEGAWSGGGSGFLALARYAAGRYPLLAGGPEAVPVVARNIPTRNVRRRRPFVLAPQNAWPWSPGGATRTEVGRVWGLRAGSELFMRRASAVLRISSAIPVIGSADRYSPVIHNVLDPGFEDALVDSHDVDPGPARGRIVIIGSCYSYRNLERLVQAHAMSGDSRQLLIAGPIGTMELAQRLGAAALDSGRVLVRWGSMPRATCLAWLRAADLVVLPSLVEASPLSALEALAVQPRVLLSDIPAHREVVRAHGALSECAYVPADSLEAWAQALAVGASDAAESFASLSEFEPREAAREEWSSRLAAWFSRVADSLESEGQR
jgi:glycosyltransferase involved in cell wall biosynthesis